MKSDDAITVLDLIAVIAKRKMLVFWITAASVILTLLFLISSKILPVDSPFNLLPDKYVPTSRILLQDNSATSSLTSMLNQSGLSTLTGLIGLTGSSRVSNADLAQTLLKGNTIKDGVGEKFAFITRYKITKNPKTAVRQKISNSLTMKYDAKSGILEVGYEDIDKVFATNVVNDITDRLQMMFWSLTMDKVSVKKEYLKTAIESAEKEAKQKTKLLSDFQTKYGIYDLTNQSEVNIEAIAKLQTELRLKQVELAVQRKYFPEMDSKVIMLKDEVDQMQKQIEQMNTGEDSSRSSSIPMSKMSKLGAEYMTLSADAKIQQSILSTLKQQYEMAKLEEMDTSLTFHVVEKAEVPELRTSPSRTKIMVIMTMAGFFIAVVLAFLLEYLERMHRDPVESEKLAMIRSSLAIRKKQPRE